MEDKRNVQLAQLDLLIELDRICTESNISYILVGGSLLGAIRHKGFIPWDDDVDVGMLRHDYEKFTELCKSKLSSEYMLHDWNNDSYSPHAFAKLKIRGTKYIESEAKNTGMDCSIFIDIFPYDPVPNGKFEKFMQAQKVLMLKKILQLKLGWDLNEGKGLLKRVGYSAFRDIAKMRDLDSWKNSLNKEITKYDDLESLEVVSLNGAYGYDRETMEKQLFLDTMKVPFEGYEVSIPKDYEKYLRRIYGDYMQLPPESERGSKHKVIEIDLGNYKIKCKEREKNG